MCGTASLEVPCDRYSASAVQINEEFYRFCARGRKFDIFCLVHKSGLHCLKSCYALNVKEIMLKRKDPLAKYPKHRKLEMINFRSSKHAVPLRVNTMINLCMRLIVQAKNDAQ